MSFFHEFVLSLSQLAFRSVTSSVQTKREQMRRILQLPPPPPPAASPPASVEEVAPTLPASVSAAASEDEERAAARDVEEAISDYLRRATENFDLTKSVEVRLSFIDVSELYFNATNDTFCTFCRFSTFQLKRMIYKRL